MRSSSFNMSGINIVALAFGALGVMSVPLQTRQYSYGGQTAPRLVLREYPEFQISNGVGGNARSEAEAIFMAPFRDCDLASVAFEDYDALQEARVIAEDAEYERFEPAIQAAGANSSDGQALRVGMIKNRVLRWTATMQGSKIKAAKHEALGIYDPEQEEERQTIQIRLLESIMDDLGNTGKRSKGVI